MSQKIKSCADRLNTVGGQAVIEGVMMKSRKYCAISVRREDGGIDTEVTPFLSLKDRSKLGRIPIVRGVANFIDMLKLSMSTLTKSTEMLGIEEEPSKFEKWLEKKLGKSLMPIITGFGMVIGVLLSVFLFMFLPTLISKLILGALPELGWFINVIEGVMRILIFIIYISLVSLWSEMHRVFQYHGAEHMSIFAHESGEELTVENAKKFKRFHPRCGTSFLVVMMIISIIFSALITWDNLALRVIIKILMLPIIVGVGYEFLMFSGKHANNIIVKILAAPGLWIQRITTKQPDDSMLEVAIASLKAALPDIYPPEKKTEIPVIPQPLPLTMYTQTER